ncbi:MAG: hypothetical protein JSR72_08860 [Proteobacteria bacterium]|nr:hypothetical protein [Pseudomonadota bacterium]
MPRLRLSLTCLLAACVALPLGAAAQTDQAPRAKPKIERTQAGGREQYRPGDIVCTKAGCRPLPANCHAVNEETWEGPTGYAIIICP